MSRTARASVGGVCYHVLNRGNAGQKVFRKQGDYESFLKLMENAHARLPMRVIGYCLMPNHFHFLLWPHADGDLSRWMQWLMTAHVRRYHRHYNSTGHVWTGRFKAFPIQQDEHLLTVMRYIERNPLRANLVDRAEAWEWSSLADWVDGPARRTFLHQGPLPRDDGWLQWVNRAQTESELATLRTMLERGSPYGTPHWQCLTARRLGIESSLRPRGRPRKGSKK